MNLDPVTLMPWHFSELAQIMPSSSGIMLIWTIDFLLTVQSNFLLHHQLSMQRVIYSLPSFRWAIWIVYVGTWALSLSLLESSDGFRIWHFYETLRNSTLYSSMWDQLYQTCYLLQQPPPLIVMVPIMAVDSSQVLPGVACKLGPARSCWQKGTNHFGNG